MVKKKKKCFVLLCMYHTKIAFIPVISVSILLFLDLCNLQLLQLNIIDTYDSLRILYMVDANIFASLALLNKTWKSFSDSTALYRHHLSLLRHSGDQGDQMAEVTERDDLPSLKKKFFREARRNVFEVFRRPKQTLIKLISASTSSSSFPQGEAFRFIFSAKGCILLALSSSRIVVLDLRQPEISVFRELKTLRRPVTATISDDATLLVVVSSSHQTHVYDLSNENVRLVQTIMLTDAPKTLALSPQGTVLAVAYDNGIEVNALGEEVLATDRRAVRCPDIDVLEFTSDGMTLVGSSTSSEGTNFVTISPPLYTESDSELPLDQLQSKMWTSQILFPEISAGYSHIALIPQSLDDDCSTWMIAYSTELKAFKLTRVDDKSAGITYFVGPGADGQAREPEPSTLPASCTGDEVLVMGFRDSGLWLYGIPNILNHTSSNSRSAENERPSNHRKPLEGEQCWSPNIVRTNSQRLRKIIYPPRYLVHGYRLTPMSDITAAQWVDDLSDKALISSGSRRLVAVAPGGVSSIFPEIGNENPPVDGGRLVIYDFSRSTKNGEMAEITIEVGEVEPADLPESGPNLDMQVELERRRTQMNSRRRLGRSRNLVIERSSTLGRHRSSFERTTPTNPSHIHRNSSSQPNSPTGLGTFPNLEGFDDPYSNTQPRSQDTLQRAATAASNRNRPRFSQAGNSSSQRTGNREPLVPHESDADNWVPPPPPYTPAPEIPLPDHIRRTLLPSMTEPLPPVRNLENSDCPNAPNHGPTNNDTIVRLKSTMGRMTNVSGANRPRANKPTNGVGERTSSLASSNFSRWNRSDNDLSMSSSGITQSRSILARFQPPQIPANDAAPSVLPQNSNNSRGEPVVNQSASTAAPKSNRREAHRSNALRGDYGPRRHSMFTSQPIPDAYIPPIPPIPQEQVDNSHVQPHLVIGRNRPMPQLQPNSNATQARTPETNITYTRTFRQNSNSLPSHNPITMSTPPTPTLPRVPKSLVPTVTTSTPLSQQRASHPRDRRPSEPTIYSTNFSLFGIGRSRSRSQEIPRRKPLTSNTFPTRRTGGMASSPQSEAGIGHPTRAELRARVDEWTTERKQKKSSKCMVM